MTTPAIRQTRPDPPTSQPTRARRARRWLGVSAALVGSVLLVYLLLSWFAFEPALRWALPRFASQHAGHQLSFRQARFDPWRLIVEIKGLALTRPDGEPLLQLEGLALDLDAASPFKRAWAVERVQLTAPIVHLTLQADGRPNWKDLLDSLAGEPRPADAKPAAPVRMTLQRLVVRRGQLALADLSHGRDVKVRVDPLDLDMADLSTLPDDRGNLRLTAALADGGSVDWRGRLGLYPFAASGEVEMKALAVTRLWPYLSPYLAMSPPQGLAALRLKYELSNRDSKLLLSLGGLELQLQGLVLQGEGAKEPALALDRLSVSGGRVDLTKREASVASVEIGPGRIMVARDANGRFDLENWVRPGPASPPVAVQLTVPTPAVGAAAAAGGPAETLAPAARAAPSATPAGWRVNVESVRADGIALQLTDASRAAPITLQAAQLGFDLSARGEFGVGAPNVRIERAALKLGGLQLASAGFAQPWFELQGAEVASGHVSTADREATIGSVTFTGGLLRAARDSKGQLPLVDALKSNAPTVAPGALVPAALPSNANPPWRYRIDQLMARDFALALREASVSPATEIDVVDLKAEVKGLSQDLQRGLPVALEFRIKSGGSFQAKGQVVPGKPSADLALAVEALSLLPVQPYVAQATTLVLKNGVAASKGRLRWQGDAGRGGWRYDGGVDFGAMQIDEAASGERFLSWQRLLAPDLRVTPEGLRITETNIDGLGSKLIIFKDKTLNVAKIMKTRPAPDAASGAAASTTAAAHAPGAAGKPFGFDIERIRIANGTLDFADLSLALPFGTRVQELTAQLVGLKSEASGPAAPAQLELNGKVGEFGLARAAGKIQLFDPKAFTDIKVEFRNVEMATLTPYSATFAGRRITSGKLSLDLEYKIDKRQLAGENKIVMDRLTLGERVESPTATNLPLDLAIALLEDSNGRIDLGLPVSGSLDDPQFSYGQVVWKAIVNVLTKIVTSPFRALGSLIGGGEQKLDSIGFDVGRAALLPPEREKLKTLAEAMAKRPGLAISVQAGYDADADAAALRQAAVRRAVAVQAGRAVAANEDPGPISLAQPASRQALEQLFTKRFGADALAALRKRTTPARTVPGAASQGASVAGKAASSAAVASDSEAASADLYPLLLQGLLDAEVVDQPQLEALAAERAKAIGDELMARALPAARVRLEASTKRGLDGRAVPTVLGLVMATAAPVAAGASAASAIGAAPAASSSSAR